MTMPRARDLVTLAFSGMLALLIACHTAVPDVAGAGTMIDSIAPWLGLAIPVLLVMGLLFRTRATVAVLLPALVWGLAFGRPPIPHAEASGHELVVATQNLYAGNDDPASTAAALSGSGADVIGVQELPGPAREQVARVLGAEHPNHATIGTVGLWSRYPVDNVERIDLGLGWTRAMRARVHLPDGPVTVYVAHLPSLRPGTIDGRNDALRELGETLRNDRSPRAVVLGDLNTASTDRAMDLLPSKARPPRRGTRDGFEFTWPANAPVVRLDHVLSWGLEPVTSSRLHTSGTDHRAVLMSFSR